MLVIIGLLGSEVNKLYHALVHWSIIDFTYATFSGIQSDQWRVNRMHQYFSLCNLFLLSKNLNFSKKSCIPLSYFISLSLVVGSRRLSGAY